MVNLKEEKKLWKKGYKWVVGLDEAGRGALCGPVVAAATMVINSKAEPVWGARRSKNSILFTSQLKLRREKKTQFSLTIKSQISKLKLKTQNLLREVKDSKKLTPKKREELYNILTKYPQIEWGIGRVSEKFIDKINIKNAAELAMERALVCLEKKIKKRADFLLIDGNNVKNLQLRSYNLKLMVKADEKVFSCAAASIIAKVDRDRIMQKYHKKYPCYGFNKHKGYPTKFHLKMLKKYGPCKIHRKTFSPVSNLLTD